MASHRASGIFVPNIHDPKEYMHYAIQRLIRANFFQFAGKCDWAATTLLGRPGTTHARPFPIPTGLNISFVFVCASASAPASASASVRALCGQVEGPGVYSRNVQVCDV